MPCYRAEAVAHLWVYYTSAVVETSEAAIQPPQPSCSYSYSEQQKDSAACNSPTMHPGCGQMMRPADSPTRMLPAQISLTLRAFPPPPLPFCSTRRAPPPRWRCRPPLRRPSAALTSVLQRDCLLDSRGDRWRHVLHCLQGSIVSLAEPQPVPPPPFLLQVRQPGPAVRH